MVTNCGAASLCQRPEPWTGICWKMGKLQKMGAFKWLAGLIGWAAWGPLGGLLGYLAASFVDSTLNAARRLSGGDTDSGYRTGGYGPGAGFGAGGGYASGGYRQGGAYGGYSATEQRNSFFISLLVLSSAVIRADGRTSQSELNCVKDFIRRNFGEQAVPQAERLLREMEGKDLNLYTVGSQIADNMNYSQRLQLFHYLAQIAASDGDFSRQEKSVLEAIASAIRLTSSDASSVISMFYKDTDSAYAVLEISPSASNDEVKSAYRRMAMKNHPDKVATLGPEVQKAAAEKFRQIQEAYETIKRQRGIS